MLSRLRDRWRRYPAWSARHPWTVLVALGLVCGASLLAARDLCIVADLGAVLPEDAPSVRNLRLAAQRVGSTEALYITAQSPDRRANRRFLAEVAAAIGRWPERPEVFFRLDVRYFRDRALYYADVADLEAVRDGLARRVRWEKVHSNPAYIDLEGEPPPAIVPPGLVDKYRAKLGDDFGDPGEWFAGWEEDGADKGRGAAAGSGAVGEGGGTGGARGAADGGDAAEDEDAAEADGGTDDDGFVYLETEAAGATPGAPAETATVLLVRFRGSAVDLDLARAAVERADCLIGFRPAEECGGVVTRRAEPLRPADYHPRMRAETGGAFRSRVVEAAAIAQDVRTATLAAAAAMTLLILLAFRQLRALAYVLLPLGAGMVVCLGVAALLLGSLNVLTAFIFAVLMGLGIDFGIHLGRRYREEREAGVSHVEALERTFRGTGRAAGAALSTTAAAFAVLIPSSFRAFSEFGLLCLFGLPASMVTAFAAFPAVATLAERWRPQRIRRGTGSRCGAAAPPRRRFAIGALAALGLVTALCGALAAELEFDYDYGKLGSARTVRGGLPTRSAVRGYTSSPALLLAETPEQARAAAEQARRRVAAGAPGVREVAALDSFVPPDQERKAALLREIDEWMSDPAFGFYEDRLDDRQFARLERWRERLRMAPVAPDAAGFPDWARALFRERDGRTEGRFAYLLTDGNLNDGREAIRLQERWPSLRLPDGTTVPVASSAFVFADIIRFLREEGAAVTGLALLAVLGLLLAHFRRVAPAVLAYVPLLVGFVWFLGLLAVFDLPVTLYSAVVFPVVAGTGIDGAIHLMHRYRERGRGSIGEALRRTGPAVALSTLTTAAGFGALTCTGHRGLATLGWTAVVGLGAVLAATLAVLPVLVVLCEGRGAWSGRGTV